MSYQEKNITVFLTSYLLIIGYYLFNVIQMVQHGGLVSARLFTLWAVVILATILVNIVGSILTNIVLSIVSAIYNGSYEKPRFIADERDKLIELKGVRVAYVTFSIGVLLAMFSFVLGQPPLIMFSLIIFFSIAGEIVGAASQIYQYRTGG